MYSGSFPVIDPAATGNNIRRLRIERGLSVRDLQSYFGFEEPRAIYKWQKGETLPTVDNLYALGALLGVPIDAILIPRQTCRTANKEQQERSCCSDFFRLFRVRRAGRPRPFLRAAAVRDGPCTAPFAEDRSTGPIGSRECEKKAACFC